MKQLTFFACLLLVGVAAAQTVTQGPIIGGVTTNSARAALFCSGPTLAGIELATDSSFTNSRLFQTPTNIASGNAALIDLDSLQSNTKYYYRAIINGSPASDRRSFYTYPCEGESTVFSFGMGSCMNENRNDDEVFDEAKNYPLRFFMHVGDWGYPDDTDDFPNDNDYFAADYNRVIQSYKDKYSYRYLSAFLKNVPIDYVWDDHDYVNDNSSANTASHTDFGLINSTVIEDPFPPGTRRNAIKGYYDMFPAYAPVDSSQGIYHKFRYGNIEVFVLDDRASRSPNTEALVKVGNQWTFNPPAGHTIIGDAQREWLLEGLRTSTAPWKFVVTSTAFNKTYRNAINGLLNLPSLAGLPLAAALIDCWSGFPMDQDSILNAVNQGNIDGVIMMSGDTHTAAIDNGQAGGLPEIMAGCLSQSNSTLYTTVPLLAYGLTWNEGGQGINGNVNVSDAFANIQVNGDDYVTLELRSENGNVIASYTHYSCSYLSGLTFGVDSLTHVYCGGDSTGEIHLTASGGTPPYLYTLDGKNFQSSNIITNLPAGIWKPAVKDAAGCTKELCVTILQPEPILVAQAVTNATCFGSNSGAIDVTATGGTGTLQYRWADGDTVADRDSLLAGSYTVTVSDGRQCQVVVQTSISQSLALGSNNFIQNPRCNGGGNGVAIATPAGGVAPYALQWSNGSSVPTQNTLTAGNYSLTITDGQGCVYADSITIAEPDPIDPNASISPDYGNANGSITLNPTGGYSPYTFNWYDGSTGNSIGNLATGVYPVTITDLYNCSIDTSLLVSFASFVDDLASLNLEVYPNPAKDQVLVSYNMPFSASVTIKLYSLIGAALYTQTLPEAASGSHILPLNGYASGTYILLIESDKFRVQKKLVVE
jgi:phosphodiesterase/alkaline phosphatase D-like protein